MTPGESRKAIEAAVNFAFTAKNNGQQLELVVGYEPPFSVFIPYSSYVVKVSKESDVWNDAALTAHATDSLVEWLEKHAETRRLCLAWRTHPEVIEEKSKRAFRCRFALFDDNLEQVRLPELSGSFHIPFEEKKK